MASPTETEHLRASSALAFARALFHAAEGDGLFEQGFAFASAVLLDLPLGTNADSRPLVAHPSLFGKLKGKWADRRENIKSGERVPDPAQCIAHADAQSFLENELREIAKMLGDSDETGTLMDMREFVSYAPRMEQNSAGTNILFSGCRYEAPDFQRFLGGHLKQIDRPFCQAIRWLRASHEETRSRFLRGDFILFEFAELRAYHPESVSRRAFQIYRSVCVQEQVDWWVWRSDPDPNTFCVDGSDEYVEAIARLAPPVS